MAGFATPLSSALRLLMVVGLAFASFGGVKGASSSSCGTVKYTAEKLTTYNLARLRNITGPELENFLSTSPMHTSFRGLFPEPKYEV